VNSTGKGDEGMGEDGEGEVAEEKAGKEKGDGFYPGNFGLIYLLLAYTITNIMQD
jgi:hypothetical protein